MTTPADPARDGANGDLPYLPPPPLAAPDVPPPNAVAPVPTDAPAEHGGALDGGVGVKAMVESQRTKASPAYGTLPAPTDAGREASRRLRDEALRKRRRDMRLGWILAGVMFGASGIAGWFVYRAFDNGANDRSADAPIVGEAGETEPEANDVTGVTAPSTDTRVAVAGPAPPTPSGAPEADAPEPTTASSPPSEPTVPTRFDTVPPSEAGPAPRIANRPEFRTVRYDLRIYDGIESDEPYTDYSVTYDTASDDYFGVVGDGATGATGATEVVSFNGDWRYAVGADGINRRVRRSELSLDPAPDTPLALLLGETDVLPWGARSYATFVEERATDRIGVDGTPVTVYVYRMNVDAFRSVDPDAHAAWSTLWSTARFDRADAIAPGTEQRQSGEPPAVAEPTDHDRPDALDPGQALEEGQAAIAFGVTERGIIDQATVISPSDDLRVEYVAGRYDDAPAALVFAPDGWVDGS